MTGALQGRSKGISSGNASLLLQLLKGFVQVGEIKNVDNVDTCKPALGVALLCLFQPGLVPSMSKVYQKDELDDDEGEGTHHTKPEPHCKRQKHC